VQITVWGVPISCYTDWAFPLWFLALVIPRQICRPRPSLKKTLRESIQRTQKLHPDKKISFWFQDEGRFGQQGTITRVWALKGKRAYAPKQTDFEWVYVFGAGWHRSKSLRIAENLTLLFLPAYSPELNPVELLWWQMRDKYFSNQVFETADQLDKDVGDGWCAVTCEPEIIRSLCLFPWIESAINN